MYSFNDCPITKTMIEYMSDLGAFNAPDLSRDFTFYEFDLKQLQLPPTEFLLDQTKKIQNHIQNINGGLEGWRKNNEMSSAYKGFSIAYNPEFIDANRSRYSQSLGAYELKQTYSRLAGEADFKQVKNSYYDTYAFNSIDQFIAEQYKELFSGLSLDISRSRVSYLYGHSSMLKETVGFHRDEFSNQLLRINIPLQTSDEYALEINGVDEFGNAAQIMRPLKVGKAYIWNTRIPHRVFCLSESPKISPRIHIVLGLVPWFKYSKDKADLSKNDLHGIPIKKIVEEHLFIKR